MKEKTFFKVAGTLLALVAVLHAFRIILGWRLELGEVVIPMWVSALAVIVLGILGYSSFRFLK